MSKKVIIVGAGVGGLATALRLLSKGYDVTIYEKEPIVGGKVNILECNNFKFDLTASILMTPNLYIKVFEDCKLNYKDYFDIEPLDVLYNVNFEDSTSFKIYTDFNRTVNTLESFSKDDSLEFFRFIHKTYYKYLLSDKYFLSKSYSTISDFINISSIYNLIKLNPFSNCYNYISKFINNDYIKNYIAFQSHYVGISPFNGPNIYATIPLISQMYGLHYIRGGMYSYIKALETAIKKLGGVINTNSKIDEIVIQNSTIVGVKLNNKLYKSDLVICNADFPYAINNLISDRYKGIYTNDKINKMKYSCSTFILYLGLNKKYPTLNIHNFYLTSNFKESIEYAFKGVLPPNPCLYIYCPSKIDLSMAPNNCESISVVVRVPNLHYKNVSWNESTISYLKQIILNNLSKINGLEDIKDYIAYENYLTPIDLCTKFNSYLGTAFGLSPTLSQTNYFRPHHKSDNVDNLYFVGSSIHPGSGVSVVLRSSELVINEIERKLNNLK